MQIQNYFIEINPKYNKVIKIIKRDWTDMYTKIKDFFQDLLQAREKITKDQFRIFDKNIGNMFIASNVGKAKANNEDFGDIYDIKGWKLLIVADGVSSSRNSKQASYIATRQIMNYLLRNSKSLGKENMQSLLVSAVKSANDKVLELNKNMDAKSKRRAHTTIVCALIKDNVGSIVWLGDSRAYKVKQYKEVSQLTHDDSWSNMLRKKGMPEEEIAAKKVSHIITQCLGMPSQNLVFHSMAVKVESGEDLLLCSDGFWNYFPDNESILNIVLEKYNSMTFVEDLVDRANEMGGKDNITVAYYKNSQAKTPQVA